MGCLSGMVTFAVSVQQYAAGENARGTRYWHERWILGFAQWPLLAWVIAGYGALSILRIRTFLEHRASTIVAHRTAIVNDRGPLAWVFLNNNFHTVHHAHPRLPWYELPSYYDKHKDHFDKLCAHYFYKNYANVFSHYFWRSKDPVPHPLLSTKKMKV